MKNKNDVIFLDQKKIAKKLEVQVTIQLIFLILVSLRGINQYCGIPLKLVSASTSFISVTTYKTRCFNYICWTIVVHSGTYIEKFL